MTVAALGLGTHRVRSEELPAMVRIATSDPRTSWIDTAPNYLSGQAQTLLNPALARSGAPVSTKVGTLSRRAASDALSAGVLPVDAAHRGYCLHPPYVHWQCARNRTELGRIRVNTVFVHNPERSPDGAYAGLHQAFTALESEAAAGTLDSYGVATWDGFDSGILSVPDLDRLARDVAPDGRHHLRAIQLPVSLVTADAFRAALDGQGPIAEAAGRGWDVYASAPLFGGQLPRLATRALANLLDPELSVAQACLLAVASCPGATRVLLSASNPAHWADAVSALHRPPIPIPTLRKVLHVLATS